MKRCPVMTPIKLAVVMDGNFKITFPFSYKTLDEVKSLRVRKYNSDDKYWISPVNQETILALRGFGFTIEGLVAASFQEPVIKKLKSISISGFGKTLYPFQNIGVSYLEQNRGRGLIADEMGLGKTIQSAAWLHLHRDKTPVIIVCPASVKLNWKRELLICLQKPKPPVIKILSGKKASTTYADIFIINYDILKGWMLYLRSLNPQVIITDECHHYKNNKAARTKAVKLLGKGAPHFIALSGTPIVNRPMEIFNAIQLINPTTLPNFWEFAKRYCGAYHNGFGWDFTGASNTTELHNLLTKSGVMIRRRKKDVLKDLPDKVRSFIPFEINNRSVYDNAENNFIQYLRQTKGKEAAIKASNAEVLTQIESLKQVAVEGKLDGIIAWIKEFLESGEKLVVFAVHKFVITRIMDEFKSISVKIDGSVSAHNREANVQLFQNNPDIKLFIGNIKAAGVGITLTAASNVAFIELPWTPGELAQAEDRIHRITQEEAVTAYYLLAQGTIDETIAELLDKKKIILDGVLDGVATDSSSLLSELMKKYK